jgi:hypothetical protein
MKLFQKAVFTLLVTFSLSIPVQAQVNPREINGARNSATDGTNLDTNVSFTLQMTLAGDNIPRDSATLGQDISISTIIRPEAEDIGQTADIIIVDFRPPIPFMRNTDGNFVTWNGSLRTLVPSEEGITLEAETEVEVFTGRLGVTGDHRIFIGFLVGDALYFTPAALRFDIEEEPVDTGPTAREQAITLFESTISPRIVQSRCIECHVSGGAAFGQALHIFVGTNNVNHLNINFGEFEEVHQARGTSFILNKVQGQLLHGGSIQLVAGSADFNSLSEFLDLLDQAQSGGSASGLMNSGTGGNLADDDFDVPNGVYSEDPYGGYYGPQ